jgi:hypothetical protein
VDVKLGRPQKQQRSSGKDKRIPVDNRTMVDQPVPTELYQFTGNKEITGL